MNPKNFAALCLATTCLYGQIPLKPQITGVPKEAIEGYFKTEIGKRAWQEHKFEIKNDPQRHAVKYSWKENGRWDRRTQIFSNRVNCSLECSLDSSTGPMVFNYRMVVSSDSPLLLHGYSISSFTLDKTRFHPKQTSRERARVSYKLVVEPTDVHGDPSGTESLGYPARFYMDPNIIGQEEAIKQHKDYIAEVPYVSWCLPAIVACHARGWAGSMVSNEDDPDFFVAWFRYLQDQLKLDYSRVFGLTLGPGLDIAKATTVEVMDKLVKDVETAHKEHWFDQDVDAQALQLGIQSIQDAVKRGKGSDAKARIEQVLKQLESIKGRAKVEVFSLVDCNLRFVASKS